MSFVLGGAAINFLIACAKLGLATASNMPTLEELKALMSLKIRSKILKAL